MKLICKKCGYVKESEIHLEICPMCKSPMQIIKKLFKLKILKTT